MKELAFPVVTKFPKVAYNTRTERMVTFCFFFSINRTTEGIIYKIFADFGDSPRETVFLSNALCS